MSPEIEPASGAAEVKVPQVDGKIDDKLVDDDGKVDKDVPPEGSKRWNDIYFKAKESERKIEELNIVINDIRKHNSDLSEIVKIAVAKDDGKEDESKDILKNLKAEKISAMKDLNWEKVTEIEDKIDDLKKQMIKPLPVQDIDSRVAAAADYSADVKLIQQFVSDVGWMNKNSKEYDEVMADAARSMDKRLSENWKGTTAERLKEVKSRVEKRFGVIDNRKFPNVGESGGSEGKGDKTLIVELTLEEKRIAHNLFPDDPKGEEKYLAQKNIIIARKRGK